MITLVFFLEELSAKALLEMLLPRFVQEDKFVLRFVPFEGKQDLEKQLVRRIRGWRTTFSIPINLKPWLRKN